MASYALLLAYSGFKYDLRDGYIGFYPPWSENGSQFLWSIDSAWGKMKKDKEQMTVNIFGGKLKLKKFGCLCSDVKQIVVDGMRPDALKEIVQAKKLISESSYTMQGHTTGWMSKTYMEAVQLSWNNIEKVLQELPEDYTVIVTADHGGHERIHGTDVAEDITISVMIKGKRFQENKELESFDIKDIAPTVTGSLGVKTPIELEGKCLV